jgi:glucose-6-phosphate isomerase
MIKFDFETYSNNLISQEENKKYSNKITTINDFFDKNKDMMGWYDIEKLFDHNLISDINSTASYIRNNCDVFLVIGIGGSYLGSLAMIEAIKPYFYNQKNNPQIYFLGTSLSSDYYYDLFDIIKDKKIIVNVISKSGTTFETSLAYQLIMNFMNNKYSKDELKERIIITTDKDHGKLREDVINNDYKSFIIPSNIGGRYSIFTPVGLLPIAVANIDINKIYLGVKAANNNIKNQIKYAIIRDLMYNKNKLVEAFVVYEPKLSSFTEWLKQLYGESLGKKEQGLLPVSFINTRDLHSLGQFIQEGNKILFETVINVENCKGKIYIKDYHKTLNEINNIAVIATAKAHLKGDVLNNIITIDEINETNLGYLFQFFMISCAISGYIENVNPFDQTGVEKYKQVMKDLLKLDK